MNGRGTTCGVALVGGAVAVLMGWTPLYATEADDRIEALAHKSYMFRTYLKNGEIRIQARDGVVTLRGTVTDASHVIMARDTVAELPGVTRVDNLLGLSTKRVTWPSDAWLTARVKTALLFHRNVSARRTEVTAADGMITLRGVAASQAQRDLTTEYADDVEGVDGVRNKMTVSKTAFAPSDSAGQIIDDASVTAQVKTALLFRRSTSTRNIQVKTEEGIVTLRGTAWNAADKTLIAKLVDDIDGVRGVVNNITLERVLSRND